MKSDTLFLHFEQGVGDAIQMSRYIPLVHARVGTLIVEVIRGMVPLYKAWFPDVEIVTRGEPVPPHDAQLPMFSLPYMFATTIETIPPIVPIPAESVPLRPEPGRIGLCWRGSATHPNDLTRSMSFEACAPLLDIPGLAWQSLQFGYETSAPLEPFLSGDFLDTARLISRCELVITVDTSVCHLAGSMGVPTWLLLPATAEWRWLQHRDDSPWYPSMRLWRQAVAGDWTELIGRVAAELRDFDAHATVYEMVSGVDAIVRRQPNLSGTPNV